MNNVSFQSLYDSMSNEQKLFLEVGIHSIWNDYHFNGCVNVALFAFYEMRQLEAGDTLTDLMENVVESFYNEEEKELFQLPYNRLSKEEKTQEVYVQISTRVAHYKKILDGSAVNRNIIAVSADRVVNKMEVIAARAAAYVTNFNRGSHFWSEDSNIMDYLKSFAISMLISFVLLGKQLGKDKRRVIDRFRDLDQENLPPWFHEKLQALFMTPKDWNRYLQQLSKYEDPNEVAARAGFSIEANRREGDLIVKEATIAEMEENVKTIQITFEIEVRFLSLIQVKID